jgi:hypothetical protein
MLSGVAGAAESTALDPAKIAAAKTSADHEDIAKAYEAEAAADEKKAEMHKNMAEAYATPGGKAWQASQAKHCNAVAASAKTAAREERELAAEHHKMATQAGQ